MAGEELTIGGGTFSGDVIMDEPAMGMDVSAIDSPSKVPEFFGGFCEGSIDGLPEAPSSSGTGESKAWPGLGKPDPLVFLRHAGSYSTFARRRLLVSNLLRNGSGQNI